uniref:Uncharacterized protein n=1 Tax=Solanum lycopersicum TaxID=4081 RepID=A0A3Q7EMV1_SOLLC
MPTPISFPGENQPESTQKPPLKPHLFSETHKKTATKTTSLSLFQSNHYE